MIFFFILALVLVLSVIGMNVYLGTKDLQKFERFDNPLFVTLIALMLLALKSVS